MYHINDPPSELQSRFNSGFTTCTSDIHTESFRDEKTQLTVAQFTHTPDRRRERRGLFSRVINYFWRGVASINQERSAELDSPATGPL